MGCDIHLKVQTRDPKTNLWEFLGDEASGLHQDYSNDPGSRNYSMFAYLAGVRNRLGWVPKFANRGLPDGCDVPFEYEDEDEGYDLVLPKEPLTWINCRDYHSMTWASAQELLDCNWIPQVPIPAVRYLGILENPGKDRYPTAEDMDQAFDSAWGYRDAKENLEYWQADQFSTDRLVQAAERMDRIFVLVPYRWEGNQDSEDLQDYSFARWVQKWIKPLADLHGGDNVRVLMAFDN